MITRLWICAAIFATLWIVTAVQDPQFLSKGDHDVYMPDYFWNFDEAHHGHSTNRHTLYATLYNTDLSQGPTYDHGIAGALTFAGDSSSYAEINNTGGTLNATEIFSWAMLLKGDSTNGQGVILEYWDGTGGVRIQQSGQDVLVEAQDTADNTHVVNVEGVFQDSEWTFFALTFISFDPTIPSTKSGMRFKAFTSAYNAEKPDPEAEVEVPEGTVLRGTGNVRLGASFDTTKAAFSGSIACLRFHVVYILKFDKDAMYPLTCDPGGVLQSTLVTLSENTIDYAASTVVTTIETTTLAETTQDDTTKNPTTQIQTTETPTTQIETTVTPTTQSETTETPATQSETTVTPTTQIETTVTPTTQIETTVTPTTQSETTVTPTTHSELTDALSTQKMTSEIQTTQTEATPAPPTHSVRTESQTTSAESQSPRSETTVSPAGESEMTTTRRETTESQTDQSDTAASSTPYDTTSLGGLTTATSQSEGFSVFYTGSQEISTSANAAVTSTGSGETSPTVPQLPAGFAPSSLATASGPALLDGACYTMQKETGTTVSPSSVLQELIVQSFGACVEACDTVAGCVAIAVEKSVKDLYQGGSCKLAGQGFTSMADAGFYLYRFVL